MLDEDNNLMFSAETLLRADDFTSSTALINELKAFPILLSMTDEFGTLLRKLYGDRKATYQDELRSTILQVYSGSDSTIQMQSKAGVTAGKPIRRPSFSLMGVTTYSDWSGAFKPEMVSQGLLPRMMVYFNSEEFTGYKKEVGASPDVAAGMANEIIEMRVTGGSNGSRYSPSWSLDERPSVPKLIPLSEKQSEWVLKKAEANTYRNISMDKQGEKGGEVFERVVENGLKIALILQTGRDIHSDALDQSLLELGYDFAEYIAEHYLRKTKEQMDKSALNEHDRERKVKMDAILGHLKKARGKGLMRSQISRKLRYRGVLSTEFRGLLDTLKASGEIACQTVLTSGRPAEYYYHADYYQPSKLA